MPKFVDCTGVNCIHAQGGLLGTDSAVGRADLNEQADALRRVEQQVPVRRAGELRGPPAGAAGEALVLLSCECFKMIFAAF